MDIKIFTRIQKIDLRINRADTGSPKELAVRLKISERQVFEYIDLMKQLSAPIAYCRKRNTYYYTKPGAFSFGFEDMSSL